MRKSNQEFVPRNVCLIALSFQTAFIVHCLNCLLSSQILYFELKGGGKSRKSSICSAYTPISAVKTLLSWKLKLILSAC